MAHFHSKVNGWSIKFTMDEWLMVHPDRSVWAYTVTLDEIVSLAKSISPIGEKKHKQGNRIDGGMLVNYKTY